MIRYATVGDPQRFFDESIDGTALAHLERGPVRGARARRSRAGKTRPGTSRCGSRRATSRSSIPSTEDETARDAAAHGHLQRAAARADPADDPSAGRSKLRVFDDLDLGLEMLVQRMINILLIEISAFHMFAWAETVLTDTDLVAGDGEAARIVSYIRQDETPHVEYLKTALTEMRDRTFIGESGGQHRRRRGRRHALGPRARRVARRSGVSRASRSRSREVEHALDGNPRRDDLLEEFHPLGSIRPTSRRHLRRGRHVLRSRP